MDNNISKRSDTLAAASGSGATPRLDLTTRPTATARPATVEPLGDNRYRVQYTASAQARDRLQRLRSLMRSTVPDGDLARIIDEAVREKLERLEAKRFGRTKTPRKTLAETDTNPSSRHVPAAVRRAVHARDEGRCTYVDRHGRRCKARDRLEFHHDGTPFGRGGDHSVGNVRLLCDTHNALLAEQEYGKEKMARHRGGGKRSQLKERLGARSRPAVSGDTRPP